MANQLTVIGKNVTINIDSLEEYVSKEALAYVALNMLKAYINPNQPLLLVKIAKQLEADLKQN